MVVPASAALPVRKSRRLKSRVIAIFDLPFGGGLGGMLEH
jgi:hypothetical protein